MFKLWVSVLYLFICHTAIACICRHTESFSLPSYDEAEAIVEAKVLERIPDPPLPLVSPDTSFGNRPRPPRPPVVSTYADFSVAVTFVHKGAIGTGRKILRVGGRDSSCYHEPSVGESYIFYLGKDGELLILPQCPRMVDIGDKHYFAERAALEKIRLARNRKGRFLIVQRDLLSGGGLFTAIKGRFKNGQRQGKWLIYAPITTQDFPSKRVILALFYKNGRLIRIERPSKSPPDDRYGLRWEGYYVMEHLTPPPATPRKRP